MAIWDLRNRGLETNQAADLKAQRDKQLTQVGNLTVLSKSANDNIKQTLSQLDNKDRYIRFLQAARSKADSINLALASNSTSEGRAMNRRTRIIIMPKLNQFYDLLNPNSAPQ